VFPVFKDVSTKPTDFNDLAILEGIATVYKQVSRAFGKECFIQIGDVANEMLEKLGVETNE
jgi:hypothetical protein